MAENPLDPHPESEIHPGAQAPAKHTGLHAEPPDQVAGGLRAVKEALKHLSRETGLIRGVGALLKMNQMTGFDCPGCAWPDPDDKRSLLGEYCENGAKAFAEEATRKRVDPEFFRKHAVSELMQWSDYELGKSGRLTHPMILRQGSDHYETISWEAAFKAIADQLNALDSPDEAIFYTSGRTSNEAAFLYQLFVRQLGTNNLPDCSNMCHESSGAALSQTIGIGKGTVTLQDIYEAELIIIAGQNPGTNHPRMMTALQQCKRNGGKIISINPLPEAGLMRFKHPQHPGDLLGQGTQLTDLFLQVRLNGDVPLVKAILCLMLEAEDRNPGSVFDRDFIQQHTTGYEALIAHLREQDVEALAAQSGISLEQIREAAELIMAKERVIVCWAMGLTQHKNAVANIQEMVNLLLLKGSIGKPGAGVCPVRGHSNVQGDRTVGITHFPGKAFLNKLEEVFEFEPPRHHGLDTVEAIKAMEEGRGRVFFAMGGNFLSATPDTEYTADALMKCDMTVHVSTKLNRSHLVHGKTALILPCLARSEKDEKAGGRQFVSVENSMGIVHQSQGDLKPASTHLLSEPEIVARLAETTLGHRSKVDWMGLVQDYDRIRDLIERCIPGFEDYNTRVRQPGGFYLPNGPRQGQFTTKDQKAHLTVNEGPRHELKEGEFLMMTIRSHDQYNTTIYGLDDRYRGIYHERRVVLMNVEDMNDALLSKGQAVNLVSEYDGVRRVAENFWVIPYDLPRRCLATYFPEANVLVPVHITADLSNTPISKSVVVRVEKRRG